MDRRTEWTLGPALLGQLGNKEAYIALTP